MSTTVQQIQNPNDPSMSDLLELFRKSLLLNINAHHIGTVQSFDSSKQTATVTINYPKTYFRLDSDAQVYKPVQVSYPILVDCPVICLGGGTTSLTFPIQKGDECLVIFNDRDMDNWFTGGQNAVVATPRLHSFTDAIALVGLRSLANVLSDYDSTRAVLKNGTTKVGVGSTLIQIENVSTSLGVQLNSLLTALSAFMLACEGASDPVVSGAATTAQPLIVAVQTALAGLLE